MSGYNGSQEKNLESMTCRSYKMKINKEPNFINFIKTIWPRVVTLTTIELFIYSSFETHLNKRRVLEENSVTFVFENLENQRTEQF